MTHTFVSFPPNQFGHLYEFEGNELECAFRMHRLGYGDSMNIEKPTSAFLFPTDGHVEVAYGGNTFVVPQGFYACISGAEFASYGKVIVIEFEQDYQFSVGQVEESGRLKYIDGCTDSILVYPQKLGLPCFNSLHFPSGTYQTGHTHPSHRVGVCSKGSGTCVTPFGSCDLYEGLAFIIKPSNGTKELGIDGDMYDVGSHKFKTEKGLSVVAFHPDSDFGPTDTDHPMVNRTIVDGVSASLIQSIQTK